MWNDLFLWKSKVETNIRSPFYDFGNRRNAYLSFATINFCNDITWEIYNF